MDTTPKALISLGRIIVCFILFLWGTHQRDRPCLSSTCQQWITGTKLMVTHINYMTMSKYKLASHYVDSSHLEWRNNCNMLVVRDRQKIFTGHKKCFLVLCLLWEFVYFYCTHKCRDTFNSFGWRTGLSFANLIKGKRTCMYTIQTRLLSTLDTTYFNSKYYLSKFNSYFSLTSQ